MTDSHHATTLDTELDLDLDLGFDDESGLDPSSAEFLQAAEQEQAAIAQIVNEQQSKMPDGLFYGSTLNPALNHEDYVDNLVDGTISVPNDEPAHAIANIDKAHAANNTTAAVSETTPEQLKEDATGLGIKFSHIRYKDNDLLPSIKPAFITQYYIRFMTNICINLVTNATVKAVNVAQARIHYKKSITPSRNLINNVSDELDSKLALSILSDIKRHENENESRMIYWQNPTLSSVTINNRRLTPVTHHDVILPVYDDIFKHCSKQSTALNLLTHYDNLYMKLSLSTKEYAEDFDPHHNPQYTGKLTSLQQSVNFLKISCWYSFTAEINSLFANKRKKPLSYARGYLRSLYRHYDNDSAIFNERLVKKLGQKVEELRYWVDKNDHSYFDLPYSQQQLSNRYAHHSISSHQLGFEVLSMLSKPIIKYEPLNNLNYDLDNGALYLAGVNEVLSFWVNKLTDINDNDTPENRALRDSILRTATRKARTFYPPSALYLEDSD